MHMNNTQVSNTDMRVSKTVRETKLEPLGYVADLSKQLAFK